jgi:hypothetical protein
VRIVTGTMLLSCMGAPRERRFYRQGQTRDGPGTDPIHTITPKRDRHSLLA